MNDALAEQIRQGQLDADFNARYAEAIAIRYRHRHIAANIFLGLCTAGTVTAFFAKLVSPTVGVSLNSVASLVSTIILPQLKWQKIEGEAISERKAWAILQADFELLAISNDVDEDKIKEYSRLRRACGKQQGNGVILPRIPKLKRQVEQEVAAYHNLGSPES
jgi:hypothetical protein